MFHLHFLFLILVRPYWSRPSDWVGLVYFLTHVNPFSVVCLCVYTLWLYTRYWYLKFLCNVRTEIRSKCMLKPLIRHNRQPNQCRNNALKSTTYTRLQLHEYATVPLELKVGEILLVVLVAAADSLCSSLVRTRRFFWVLSVNVKFPLHGCQWSSIVAR